MQQDKPADGDQATIIDCVGLACPLPVLKARKALKGLRPGALIRLESSDPIAVVDVPHMAREEGHVVEFVEVHDDGNRASFFIRRGSP